MHTYLCLESPSHSDLSLHRISRCRFHDRCYFSMKVGVSALSKLPHGIFSIKMLLPEANNRKPMSGVDRKNIKCLSVRCLEVDSIIISSLTSVYSQGPRFFPFFCFATIRKLVFIFHLVPASCKMVPSYPHRHQNPKQGQREGIKRVFPFQCPCLLSREIIFSRKPIRSSFMSS